MREFFIFCSGANTSILEECPTERTKFIGIGATIAATAVLAGLSGGYALYTVFQSLALAIPFAVLWALIIFNLDRVIVSSMRKQKSFRQDLLFASPRFVLALLLAIVISKPLELRLFNTEIQAEITRQQNKNYRAAVTSVNAAYPELATLRRQNKELSDETLSRQRDLERMNLELDKEIDGTGGTRKVGEGPIYRAKKERYDAVKGQVDALAKSNQATLDLNNSRIKELELQRDQRIRETAKSDKEANRFLSQVEALSRLSSESSAVLFTSWLVTLLFMALETAPVSVKLMSTLNPYRPYDQKMEDEELQVVEVSEQFRTLLRRRLDTMTQSQISQLNDGFNTEVTLSTEKNRQRLATEVQANENLMRRIAAAQVEIADSIVEKWRAEELEKLRASAAADYVHAS